MADTSILPIAKEGLFPYLSGRDLLSLCQTNQAFAVACRDDQVWREKILDEYNNYYTYKPDNITWRQYYLLLLQSHDVTIFFNNEIIMIPSRLVTLDYLYHLFDNDDTYGIRLFMFNSTVLVNVVDISYITNQKPVTGDISQVNYIIGEYFIGDKTPYNLRLKVEKANPPPIDLRRKYNPVRRDIRRCDSISIGSDKLIDVLVESGLTVGIPYFDNSWHVLIENLDLHRVSICKLLYGLNAVGLLKTNNITITQ